MRSAPRYSLLGLRRPGCLYKLREQKHNKEEGIWRALDGSRYRMSPDSSVCPVPGEKALLGMGAVWHLFPSQDSHVRTVLSEHAGIFGDHCVGLQMKGEGT